MDGSRVGSAKYQTFLPCKLQPQNTGQNRRSTKPASPGTGTATFAPGLNNFLIKCNLSNFTSPASRNTRLQEERGYTRHSMHSPAAAPNRASPKSAADTSLTLALQSTPRIEIRPTMKLMTRFEMLTSMC